MTITVRAASVLGMMVISGLVAAPAAQAQRVAMVVPARQHMIQLGMDIALLRNGELVCYERMPGGETVLHHWDRRAREWVPLSLESFAQGRYQRGAAPQRLYVIGTDLELTAEVLDGAAHAREVERIPTMLPAAAVNQLNESLRFSRREWQMLAERYNLSIVDKNEERRRWGRFGPPDAPRHGPARQAPDAEPDARLAPLPVKPEAVEPEPADK